MLSRSKAVLAALEANQCQRQALGGNRAHVSFSNVTVALCGLSAPSDAGVTERDVIFPLCISLDLEIDRKWRAYQKLKKSLTSFSLVCAAMFLTLRTDQQALLGKDVRFESYVDNCG